MPYLLKPSDRMSKGITVSLFNICVEKFIALAPTSPATLHSDLLSAGLPSHLADKIFDQLFDCSFLDIVHSVNCDRPVSATLVSQAKINPDFDVYISPECAEYGVDEVKHIKHLRTNIVIEVTLFSEVDVSHHLELADSHKNLKIFCSDPVKVLNTGLVRDILSDLHGGLFLCIESQSFSVTSEIVVLNREFKTNFSLFHDQVQFLLQFYMLKLELLHEL